MSWGPGSALTSLSSTLTAASGGSGRVVRPASSILSASSISLAPSIILLSPLNCCYGLGGGVGFAEGGDDGGVGAVGGPDVVRMVENSFVGG